MPGAEPEQPAGAEAAGAMSEVIAWGTGLATTVEAMRASKANVLYMIMIARVIEWSE